MNWHTTQPTLLGFHVEVCVCVEAPGFVDLGFVDLEKLGFPLVRHRSPYLGEVVLSKARCKNGSLRAQQRELEGALGELGGDPTSEHLNTIKGAIGEKEC